ncbi:MAG: hypothetical protein OXC99_04325 [Chloroflexi bacterium]|nr:hypothetical protein [Chloroflexota bacterium]
METFIKHGHPASAQARELPAIPPMHGVDSFSPMQLNPILIRMGSHGSMPFNATQWGLSYNHWPTSTQECAISRQAEVGSFSYIHPVKNILQNSTQFAGAALVQAG